MKKQNATPNPLPKLCYSIEQETTFHHELMAAASAYLSKKNDHRFANARLLTKNAITLLLCIVFYWLSLNQNNPWLFFICYFMFIMLTMVTNINAQHDACHNVLFRSRLANRLVGRLVTLPLGIDPDYWRTRHVDYHHIYPNIESYDLDMEEKGVLRQTPFQTWYPHMRYQQYYWPITAALSLPYIAWFFDWSDRLGKTPLVEKKLLTGWQGWCLFLSSKILHFIIALVIPILVLADHGIGWPTVLSTYLMTQMLASLIVVSLLLGTHWSKPTFYPAPHHGKMQHGWYHHNFTTSCDWNPTPQKLDELFGGLNLHLTHHLFPGWSHRHYPALAVIVEQLAQKHQLPYRCLSYREIMIQQQQFIKQMGQKPNEPQNHAEIN